MPVAISTPQSEIGDFVQRPSKGSLFKMYSLV